jgi:hypothetical protein
MAKEERNKGSSKLAWLKTRKKGSAVLPPKKEEYTKRPLE